MIYKTFHFIINTIEVLNIDLKAAQKWKVIYGIAMVHVVQTGCIINTLCIETMICNITLLCNIT